MGEIQIKLKACCLTCKHFDASGIMGLSPYIACCGDFERVIACGHMAVCKIYLESADRGSDDTAITSERNKI